MTAQMESIESSMEARARGATTGQDQPTEAYGSQVYASVGSSLEEVRQTSSETADRLQVPSLPSVVKIPCLVGYVVLKYIVFSA